MNNYPHLDQHAVDGMMRLVKAMRHQTRNAELELRFGVFCNGKFTAGVPHAFMDSLLTDFVANDRAANGDWDVIQDFHYTQGSDGRQVRARATYDTSTLSVTCTRCRKSKLDEVIIASNRADGIAIRAVLSEEIPVEDDVACVVVKTDLVRIRQRRRFYEGTARNWGYDLTYTWHGKNKTEAESNKELHATVYEVELDLLRGQDNFQSNQSDECIALSALLKASNLLTTDALCPSDELKLWLVPPRAPRP